MRITDEDLEDELCRRKRQEGLESCVVSALTELQEKRKDPWNRDIEALHEYLGWARGNQCAIVVFMPGNYKSAHLIEGYNDWSYGVKDYISTDNDIICHTPIAWLPWEG